MDDLVLEGFVRDFAEKRALSNLPMEDLFEAFAASCVLRKHHQSDITGMEDDILVGGSGDGGIDAIAILANGRAIATEEDLKFFFDNHGRLDIEFVFAQSKSSSAFNASDIGTFVFGVEQFFRSAVSSVQAEFKAEIDHKIGLTRSIYSQAIRMQDNPTCSLYYVTAGKWMAAPEPSFRLADGKGRLESLNLFSSVSTLPLDADSLKATYRELERSVVKEVELTRTASFPRIDKVDQAYIGLLSGDEFIKLVSTDDGQLNRGLFFDNVRDFQGHNPVNREISHTLSDQHLRNNFPLLNNGITIIAGAIKRTAETFEIRDFQIVNGCQTTHILFRNREVVGPDTFIPVKVVVTEDSQIVNDVIKATNRQTVVLPEALESLTPFHRELEDFYITRESKVSLPERIYYERRSKQYVMDNIHPSNIVSLTGQIKAFIAMFLNEPHSHPHYYGGLLKAYEGRIFASDHRPEPYYASGVALLLVEKWLNAQPTWRELRPYKHQLLMLLRLAISGDRIPRLNSHGISTYSLKIVDILREPERGHDELTKACELLRGSLSQFRHRGTERSRTGERNPPHRLRAFTERLKQTIETDLGGRPEGDIGEVALVPGTQGRGVIKFFDDVKRYGFVTSSEGIDLFVHESEIGAIPYHLRVKGIDVTYEVAQNPKSPTLFMASKVNLVPRDQVRSKTLR